MKRTMFFSAAALCLSPGFALAQQARELPPIVADRDEPIASSLSELRVEGETLAARRAASPDAIALLRGAPGFSAYSNGGISSLPVMRGMADDRLLTTVDGAPVTSFCPNHMNPAGSYVLSGRAASVIAQSTLAPVSAGGDNIGGIIAIDSAPPQFSDDGVKISGRAGATYRSVADAWGADYSTTIANGAFSLGYDASYAYAENYKRGGGDRVRSTSFEAYDQALTFGARGEGQLLTLKAGKAFVPYEAFPTQRMDMTKNDSVFVNAAYKRDLGWAELNAHASWRKIDHEMNFLADKGGQPAGGMPMIADGDEGSAQVSLKGPRAGVGVLSAGLEVQQTRLDDYWPAVPGSMMMGPNTYVNINDGQRDRYAIWGEWEAKPAKAWTATAGLRYERVETTAGNVQAYGAGMMHADDVAAAAAFNARDRNVADDNVDAALKALWRPSQTSAYEFGFTRKTRTPNLYERYAWGMGAMSSSMTSLAGDANSYVGDIDLKPEIAHSLAASAQFADGAAAKRSLTISAYHSWVSDYIDADKLADLANGFVRLRFANHDAALYGLEISGKAELWNNKRFGAGAFSGAVSYTRGENSDTGDALYHIAPITSRLAIEQTLGRYVNALEVDLVGEKSDANALRHEPETEGYALLHLRTSAALGAARLDLGVENLFDTDYDLPLGGVSYGDYKYAGGGARPIYALPGAGRSFNVGLSVAF